ncbi:MAG: AcrB/AcrD/AcrF family protein [Acidobacteria bacterium]|nr:MAG: AcrB/AcrD/AcrF family protein [Acidobacteriota bacterium]REJ99383.1 MAG: AcrB/AcrD/AcrF family protein [Acidobacteriota bacterium]
MSQQTPPGSSHRKDDDVSGASGGDPALGAGDGESGGSEAASSSGLSSDEAAPEAFAQGDRRTFVTDRPVAVLMLFLALVVFGALSYQRLPVTLMPELSYPTLTVRTEYPGAAPEEVENDISRRIEEALGVVGGLRRMSSVSRAGVSDVVLEFSWDTEMSDAVQDTLEKLDLVFLPDQAERPLLLRFDPSLDPVLELSLAGEDESFSGEAGLTRLRRLAELQVKRALEPISGVAAVRVRGGLEEEIHVRLDEEALERTRISPSRVIDRLAQENINLAGGTLKEGRTEFMVRTVNEFTDLDQIRRTVVQRIDGRDVRVEDLGVVERGHRDREILTRSEGVESVQLDVYKEADANMVALAKRVREAVGEIDRDAAQRRLVGSKEVGGEGSRRGAGTRPPGGLAQQLYESEGAALGVVADRSLFIEGSISEVRNTAILGGVLAVVVLFLFLRNLVSTLVVAVAIPISLLITFAPLSLLDVSMNIMSLGGLALGIGMLVDSSIVVLESIFRCREEGDGRRAAAVRGTLEVRSAVVASILTSIAVFFPMVFVEGIAGQAFGDLGLAVVISLLASMVVALGFVPMLASRRGWSFEGTGDALQRLRHWNSWRQARDDWGAARAATGARRLLLPVLALVLVVRLFVGGLFEALGKLVVGVVILLVWLVSRFLAPPAVALFRITTRPLLAVTERGLDALQRGYRPALRGALATPALVLLGVGLVLLLSVWMLTRLETELLPEVRQGEFTLEVALPVGTPLEETERLLSPLEEVLLEEQGSIESVLVTYGYDVTNAQRSDEGEHTARFKILLEPMAPQREDELVERLRRRFASLPDTTARVTRPVLFSFKTPIEVEVHGEDLVELRQLALEVEDRLQRLPELADVESTMRSGAPEIQIAYDRELLSRYGLNIADVAALVRNQVKGEEATLYNLRDRRVPIIVRLAEEDRASVADLRELVVNPGGERPIVLDAVADVRLGEGPSEIRRVDSRRVALVRANLGEASLGTAVDRIEAVLDRDVEWPSDTTFVVSGQSREWERSQRSLWLALGLSVFLVYVIMAAQFESLVHPLVIMVSIPLAFFGTVATLFLLDVNLSIVVFLGMILLAGIVVNNAIVLVDYINTLRRRGLELVDAVVTAGTVRLRPILMTTATTTLGLLPMALGLGQGAEIRTPMALAVIGGLVSSTVLTLIVVPVVYALFDRALQRLLGRANSGEAAEPSPGVARRDEGDGLTLQPESGS